MAVLKYKSGGKLKTLGIVKSGVSVVSGVSSVNGKTGVVTGVYDVDNPPLYPVTSVNGKTGNVTVNEIKIARVTTNVEALETVTLHKFLKSSLPNLNSSLPSSDAILAVISPYIPVMSYDFKYDGNYVTVKLILWDGSSVDNSQTLTVFYR